MKKRAVVTFINTVEKAGIGKVSTSIVEKKQGIKIAPTLGDLINKNKNN